MEITREREVENPSEHDVVDYTFKVVLHIMELMKDASMDEMLSAISHVPKELMYHAMNGGRAPADVAWALVQ